MAGVKNSVVWPKAPSPLITRAVCLQLHYVSFLVRRSETFPPLPPPLRLRRLCWHLRQPRRALHARGIPAAHARDLGIHEAP